MSLPTSEPRITLSSVARHAGVSVPTVSKVLNGRDDVADDTRQRVQLALRQLGYASPSQRKAAERETALVDLVIDRLNSPYSIEVTRGIVDLAAEEQVEIVISTLNAKRTSGTDSDAWARRLRSAGRRGLILLTSDIGPTQLASLRRHEIAVALIDPLNMPHGDHIATIGATNWSGGREGVEHLLGLGHRRIAFMGGPEHAYCNQSRLHGYMAALMGAGIEVDPTLVTSGEFDIATGRAGLERLMGLPSRPTAVFAASDMIALGVISQAHELGVRVPEELSVVGFDGTPVVEQTTPRLTSVAQPLREMGRVALRTVLRLSQGEEIESSHVELATRLEVRSSTAPPISS